MDAACRSCERRGVTSMALQEIVDDVLAARRPARAIIGEALDRVAALNDDLNAFVAIDAGDAERQADEVDRRVAAGERPALAGVVVGIKDNIWVAGRRVTQGSRLFAGFTAPADAIAVGRLRQAGAVILGSTNTPEFAAKGVTTNLLFGPTRHPRDGSLTPGGSSGGSVVAVASGMIPLALGTDAGGSSRRPPAHVGVVGFKPSFGAIPYGPGFVEPFCGISVIAPIAASVDDVTMAFDALAGPDPRDPDSLLATALPDEPLSPATARLAYSPTFGLAAPVDGDVRLAVETAVARLRDAGWSIRHADPVWPEGCNEDALMPLQHAGLAAIHGAAFRRDPGMFDPDIAAQIRRGFDLPGPAVAAARILGAQVATALAAFFCETDILLGPTTPCTAWPLDRLGPERIGGVAVEARAHAAFTPLFNHALVPALSLPCGHGRDGLPVGLQIVARRGSDRRLLAFARQAERILAT